MGYDNRQEIADLFASAVSVLEHELGVHERKPRLAEILGKPEQRLRIVHQ